MRLTRRKSWQIAGIQRFKGVAPSKMAESGAVSSVEIGARKDVEGCVSSRSKEGPAEAGRGSPGVDRDSPEGGGGVASVISCLMCGIMPT